MAARPSRLSKNRHGTYCLRWIVPVQLRGSVDGAQREMRFSLRTTDPNRARILALEFNLALERMKAMTKDVDPRVGVVPMTVSMGGSTWEIRDDNDRQLFNSILKEDKDLREAVLQSIRSGMAPAEAMAALVNQVKTATGAIAPVAKPISLKNAAAKFEQSRPTVSDNRRSTAGEKGRTIALLMAYLTATDRPAETLQVHEIKRGDLVAFIGDYATRPGKADVAQAAAKKDPSAAAPASKRSGNEVKAKTEKLSPRTVIKAIGHLHDFFVYAMGMDWIALNPMDNAFDEATKGFSSGASSAKRSNSYDLFTDAEVQRIFEPLTYLKNMNAADDFWVPLIGLYTGARLGEIVTLPADGIRGDNDAGCFVMHVERELPSGDAPKTLNSVRQIPIPNDLLQLGLIDYVHHVQSLGATMLFPHREMNATRANDPSKHVSRAFGAHLGDIGIKSPSKVFHSLRHTVITRMHVRGVPVAEAELIVGHAAQDAHLRMNAVSNQRGGHSSTHMGTYVDTAAFDDGRLRLPMRLKLHMDRALDFRLDGDRLRKAAWTVKQYTVKRADGTFSSGWHTNNKVLGKELLQRVASVPSSLPVAGQVTAEAALSQALPAKK